MASYKRLPLKPYPNGWYVLAESKELLPKQILTRRFAGREVVIFRTEKGEAAVAEAYCPHMGGHFGHGGTVEGERSGFQLGDREAAVDTGQALGIEALFAVDD